MLSQNLTSYNTLTNQSTNQILLVRPRNFGFNTETASSNDYQRILPVFTGSDLKLNATAEFDQVVDVLKSNRISTLVIEDTDYPAKPDAVFPNNWVATLPDGKVFLFPMHRSSRSAERRTDIIDELRERYEIDEVIDLSYFEERGKALEGTGSIVFDHNSKLAFACLSARTDEDVLNEFCMISGYRPFVFSAFHSSGSAIYHTNVILSIGEEFALLCLDVIPDLQERKDLVALLERAGKEVIEISQEQQEESFACNALQVNSTNGDPYLVFSERAKQALKEPQLRALSKHGQIISASLPTIESVGGGGIRCLLAEIFLKRKLL